MRRTRTIHAKGPAAVACGQVSDNIGDPDAPDRPSETASWRNWQTRWIQNPVPVRAYRFDSDRGHSDERCGGGFLAFSLARGAMAKQSFGAAGSSGGSTQPNAAASRTLDSVARSAPLRYRTPGTSGTVPLPRPRMWPTQGWRRHGLVVLTIAFVALAAYSNSFGPGSNRKPEVNWTLDNKYIIQLDPRTKATTWNDIGAQSGQVNIWTKDYWWPKGISGLYRPIVTWSYWFNWHVIGGDETRIDPDVEREIVDAT